MNVWVDLFRKLGVQMWADPSIHDEKDSSRKAWVDKYIDWTDVPPSDAVKIAADDLYYDTSFPGDDWYILTQAGTVNGVLKSGNVEWRQTEGSLVLHNAGGNTNIYGADTNGHWLP